MNRRGFITGLGTTLFAAPAIVRVASIMPVKSYGYLDPVWADVFVRGSERFAYAYVDRRIMMMQSWSDLLKPGLREVFDGLYGPQSGISPGYR